MVFGRTPVKWNGTRGEISQGTCKVYAGADCVTPASLQSHVNVKGGGRIPAQHLPEAGIACGKTNERMNCQIYFFSFSYGTIKHHPPHVDFLNCFSDCLCQSVLL